MLTVKVLDAIMEVAEVTIAFKASSKKLVRLSYMPDRQRLKLWIDIIGGGMYIDFYVPEDKQRAVEDYNNQEV